MLSGGHLVMLCLCENAQLPKLLIQFLHIGDDPGLDGTEIMVIQLLPFGRLCAEQSAAAVGADPRASDNRIC